MTDELDPFAGEVHRADRYNDWIFERCRPHLGPAALDYGAGICDNKASFTVNGVVHEITLH
jgi:hypothetical protein